jgi:hypothetical protein
MGIVTYKNDSGAIKNTTDLCIGNTVMEAVCDLNGYAYNGKTTTCVNGCENGACKVNCTSQSDCPTSYGCDIYYGTGICWALTNPNYQFCTDSDNGYFPNAKGTVTWKDGAGVISNITDSCIGNTVMEAVCDYNGYAYNGKTANCVNGCENNACEVNCTSQSDCPAGYGCDIDYDTGICWLLTNPNHQFCTDSDGGYSPNVKGTVTYKNAEGVQSSVTDSCIGNTVMEAVCDYNGYAYNGKTANCANNCSNGACVNIASINKTCTDSDGGMNYYVKGTTTDSLGTALDTCSSDSKILTEYKCSGNDKMSVTYVCPNSCSNGVCVNPTSTNQTTQSNITSPIAVNNTLVCISGCLYKDKCLPYGYRTGTKYCNIDNSLTEQNSSGACENSFECVSNLCTNGKCISPSFLQKIINFFKNLFGIQ